MMQKMSAINALVNSALLAGGAVKGTKKFKQEINTPSVSSHDMILNNKNENLPSEKVVRDADFKSASELINSLLLEKIAEEKDNSFLPKGVAALLLAAATASAISNKNPLAPFRQTANAAKEIPKIFTDKILGKKRFGRVILDSLRKGRSGAERAGARPKFVPPGAEPKKAPIDRIISGIALGGGIGAGNLAVHMIGDKYFDSKSAVRKSYDSFPELTGPYHEVLKKGEKKQASEIIDELLEKEAGTFSSGKHFAKKLLKEDVAQNALGSIPFFAVPAAASYVTGRDLKYDAKKISRHGKDKIVIDIPLSDFKKKSEISKTAGVNFKNARNFVAGRKSALGKMKEKMKSKVTEAAGATQDNLHKSPTWKEFFKYEMPSRSVKALTWALPATALTALTGRNLRGSFEKTDSKNNVPLEPGKARVTIETSPHRHVNEVDPKLASETIDDLHKIAIDEKIDDNSLNAVKKTKKNN